MHLPYVFDHAVYVRWGAPMSAPGIFPGKGIGIGPGGRGSPAGDRDVDWLMFVSAFSCEWLHRTAESRFWHFHTGHHSTQISLVCLPTTHLVCILWLWEVE